MNRERQLSLMFSDMMRLQPKFFASLKLYKALEVTLSYNIYKILYIMLPEIHRHQYQGFLKLVDVLQQSAVAQTIQDRTSLSKTFQEMRLFFQEKILSLPADELDDELMTRMQSYQTEIHKQLRLVGTDVLFLQASREPATSASRQVQLNDRIKTLIGYCEAVLGLGERDEA